jgi:hypothetical protein
MQVGIARAEERAKDPFLNRDLDDLGSVLDGRGLWL